jgi:phosphoribosylanthranilate isomerase
MPAAGGGDPMHQRTRIKICGLTREQDVDAAADAGADAVGFVFYERSPRAVDVQRAAVLARRLPPFMTPVGLFVNAPREQVARAIAAIPNLLLQFHGDETAEECRRYARPYLRAAEVSPGFDLVDFSLRYSDAQAVLLDAVVEGYGGGGKVFDWSLVQARLQDAAHPPVVLSGGLSAANVMDGIAALRPSAVDVSSGVESSKGIKDALAIRRFCDAVRQADARLAEHPPG